MSHWFVSAKGWIHRGWLVLRVFFFFLPGVDKQQRRNIRWTGYFPAGRIPEGISVPKGRSELLSLWRFFCWKKRRVFIHEKEMTITYFAKNMLPRFLAENCVQEVFRDDLAGDWKRNCVLYAFFTHRQYIILSLSFYPLISKVICYLLYVVFLFVIEQL